MISYPKRTSVTLPSVEGGFGTLPIKREPPRSLYTYYRPKVGENNDIIEMIDASDDRVCEAIQVYSRNRNPMVTNDFSFGGTNTTSLRLPQPILPYRLSEVFRPPARTEQSLLPLSRLPRGNIRTDTNRGSSATVIDAVISCPTNLREIQKQIRDKIQVESSKTYPVQIMESPSPEAVQHYLTETLKAIIETNASANRNGVTEEAPETSRFIQDTLPVGVQTNVVNPLQKNGVVTDYRPRVRQNATLVSAETNKIQPFQPDLMLPESLPQLRIPLNPTCPEPLRVRRIESTEKPQASIGVRNEVLSGGFQVNPTRNIDLSAWNSKREMYLRPTLKKGGFSNQGTMFK